MLQYIIYSSLIWLVSLVMYEWLFKKESFHQFNRIYLLFSLSAGLIIPLINFSKFVSDSQQTILKPVTQVYKMKESLVVNPTHALRISTSSFVFNVEQFLWVIYIIGILIGSVLLMKEIIYLIKLFHNGHKTNELDCIIVQTGKSHAAFSIFNILFINHKDDYTKAQWEFLIAHEKEHHQQLHIIDNLLFIMEDKLSEHLRDSFYKDKDYLDEHTVSPLYDLIVDLHLHKKKIKSHDSVYHTVSHDE